MKRLSILTRLALIWAKRPRFTIPKIVLEVALFIGAVVAIFGLIFGLAWMFTAHAAQDRAARSCTDFANDVPANVPMRCQPGWKP